MTMFITCTMIGNPGDKIRINVALIADYYKRTHENFSTIVMATGGVIHVMETMEQIHTKLASRGIT